MSNGTIQPGDVVKLKSGSLPMTVTETDARLAWVVWSTPSQDIKTGTFELIALAKI